MHLALSPYALTMREPAAMAALLLGESVLTYLPSPGGKETRKEIGAAMRAHPRYARLLDSWTWSIPLWREGLIESKLAGEDVIDDIRSLCSRVRAESSWEWLRPFLHKDLFEMKGDALDAICADMLKGGPDPGISSPISAGLDAFACRHHLTVVRTGALGSRSGAAKRTAAQEAEARLGETSFAVAVPILTQAGCQTVLEARAELRIEIADLLDAMRTASKQSQRSADVRDAARAYSEAFTRFAEPVVGHDDDAGVRIVTGFVRLTGQSLPAEAALLSMLVAFRRMQGHASTRREPELAKARPAGASNISSIVVEPMTIAPSSVRPSRAAGQVQREVR